MPERNLIVKETFDEKGLATVLASYKADGLTIEMIKPFFDDPKNFFKETMSNRMEAFDMAPVEGLPTRRWLYFSPFPLIANRQYVETNYKHEEDGWMYSMYSSIGNEYLEEQEKDHLGSDV